MNSLTREKGDTKEFRRLVLGEFFLAKGEGNKNMNSTLLFSRFGKPENFRKLFAKEEEEEVQRDSKVVKEYVEKLFVKVVSCL